MNCAEYNERKNPGALPVETIPSEWSSSIYIRITNGYYDVSREDEAQSMFKSTVIAASRHFPGFGSYTGGLNNNSAESNLISTWETEEQPQGFRNLLDAETITQIRDTGVELDAQQIYETVV